jgi:hypothetical protein
VNLVFVFSYRHGGGVPQVFARYAVQLAKSADFCVSVVNFHYQKFPSNYKYKFLHQQEGAVIGRSLTRRRFDGSNLEQLLDQLNREQEGLRNRSFEYVTSIHNIEITITSLIASVRATSLCSDEIRDVSNSTQMIYDMFKFFRKIFYK